MTNAEAIKALKDIWFEYIDHLSVESMKHIEYKPAIDMAVEALEKSEISNENSNESQIDLINRRDAVRIVDSIDTWQAGWRGNAIESLKALPSAQPNLSEWARKVEEYRKSVPDTIYNPLAWALYQVWKEYDR